MIPIGKSSTPSAMAEICLKFKWSFCTDNSYIDWMSLGLKVTDLSKVVDHQVVEQAYIYFY